MARKPTAARAAKKAAGTKPTPSKPKKAAAAKHGGTVVTKDDIAAAEANAETKTPTTIKLPSPKYIKDLVTKTLVSLEAEKNSAVGDIGGAIATATEKHNVEKRALALVRRLSKMPDKKFQETWWHFLHYAEALGFQARADKQGQLDLKQAEAVKATDSGDQGGGEGDDTGTKMKIVDAPATGDADEPSLADAMGDAIEQDDQRHAVH